MNIPTNLKYTKTDEWFDPATGAMGLTDYAQGQLSDIVFVEIVVSAGDTVEPGKPIASVESVKAAAETYASVSGKVVAVNEDLSGNPEDLEQRPLWQGLDGQGGRRRCIRSDGCGCLHQVLRRTGALASWSRAYR